MSISSTVSNLLNKGNKLAIGAGAASLIAGATVYAAKKYASNRKKSKRKAASHTHTRKGNHRSKGQRYHPHTAGKGKDTSHKRIRYTKKGQPYIIMGNGRARFISKKGAKRSHKTKGGRY